MSTAFDAVNAWCLSAFCGLVLAGCASPYPPAPILSSNAEYHYLIGPGDKLSIMVHEHPELSLNLPVLPDGKITVPLGEDIQAAGRDASELARLIEEKLARKITEPMVSVTIIEAYAAFNGQVRVVGEVLTARTIPYIKKMRLLDVMIAAGGTTERADGNRATILRTAEGNKQYNVRIKDLVQKGDVSANIEMRPGDILIVPRQ